MFQSLAVEGTFKVSIQRANLIARLVAINSSIRNTEVFSPFHEGSRYHIETSPLICGAN